MESLQRAWLTIGAVNFTAVVAFYRALLQQEPAKELANRYAEFHPPGMALGIFCPATHQGPQFSAPAPGGFSLCLEVDDLDTAIARLRVICPTSLQDSQMMETSHGREIYVFDPGGNRIILHQSS